MRVLVISKYFAPENAIGAIRATKMAKYLHLEHGCEITAVTRTEDFAVRDTILEQDLSCVQRVIRVAPGRLTRALERFYAFRSRRAQRKASRSKESAPQQARGPVTALRPNELRGMAYVLYSLNFLQEWLKCRDYAHQAFRAVRAAGESYDVIFSTYSPISEHYIGLACKKRWKNAVWIADFRDAPYNLDAGMWVEKVQSHFYVKAIRRRADWITTISDGVAQDMGVAELSKTRTIYNGYDPEDMRDVPKQKRDRFTLTFAGNFYSHKRDLRPVFRALRALMDAGGMRREDVCVAYAGQQFDVLTDYARESGLTDLLEDHGMVDRQRSLALQKASHLLLLASWNETGGISGVMTGKFLEYMMIGNPIVASIVGDLPHSLIWEHITQGHMGFCYEEASEPESFEQLKAYLLAQYEAWRKTGRVAYAPEKTYLARFGYPALAQELYALAAQRPQKG